MAETYGEWLRRIRTDAGLTQEDLGNRIGVNRTYVNKIERGRIDLPLLETRQRIAAAIGSDYDPYPVNVPEMPNDATAAQISRTLARWTPEQRRWLLDLMERTDAMLGTPDADDTDTPVSA